MLSPCALVDTMQFLYRHLVFPIWRLGTIVRILFIHLIVLLFIIFFYNVSLWMLPSMVLKKMVMGNFNNEAMDPDVADSIDFMVEKVFLKLFPFLMFSCGLSHFYPQLESLSQSELASRLTLNCSSSYVNVSQLQDYCVTIVDVFDECAITLPVREDMHRSFPNASMAHLKNGGNFPYLSRSDEVNLFIQIHLRRFANSRLVESDILSET